MNKKGSIIVTGATGFVGRRLVKLLVKEYKKQNILCLIWDKNNPLETSGRKILKELGLKTKKVDLVTKKGLNNLPKNPSLIIHLAANTDTNKTDHRVNSIGTQNLVEAIKPADPNTHFIHVSTMVEMSGRKNCSQPFTETDKPAPTNEYTRTKFQGEQYVISKAKEYGFKLSVLKPNTIYGNGMRPDSLFDFVKKLINKKSILAQLNWPGLSSLIHVDDVAKAIILVAHKPPKPGKSNIFLLHGENLTLADISLQLHKALNMPYKKIILPEIFWKICASGRNFVPLFERITSPKIYNLLWRASIIVDNAIYCKPINMTKFFPHWKPTKLKDNISELI